MVYFCPLICQAARIVLSVCVLCYDQVTNISFKYFYRCIVNHVNYWFGWMHVQAFEFLRSLLDLVNILKWES